MRNGAPFSKPRVRLYGATGDAQNYLGAAYNLLFKVRQFCGNAGAPVFAMQRSLPDGAVVQAAILGNEEIVSCFPPAHPIAKKRTTVEPDGKSSFYMDFGWVRRKNIGRIEGVGPQHFSIENSSGSRETFFDVWSEEIAKSERIPFSPTADDYDEEAGKSCGINCDYSGDEGELRYERDVAKMLLKERAYPLSAKATGLLRVWVKALLARSLGDEVDITNVDLGGVDIFNIQGVIGNSRSCSVFIIEDTFFFVEIFGNAISFAELAYPESLKFLSGKLYSKKRPETKLACAAYLLAYTSSKPNGMRFTVRMNGRTPWPAQGWFFSHFTNEAVGVSVSMGSGGVIFFRETLLSLKSASLEAVRKEYNEKLAAGASAGNIILNSLSINIEKREAKKYSGSMPWIWDYNYFFAALIRAPVYVPPDALGGPLGSTDVYSFFSINDKVKRLTLGCSIYELEPRPPETSEYSACGWGVSYKTYRQYLGQHVQGYSVSDGTAWEEKESEKYFGTDRRVTAPTPVLREDSNVAGGVSGCHVEVISISPNPVVTQKGYYSRINATDKTGLEKSFSDKQFCIRGSVFQRDVAFVGNAAMESELCTVSEQEATGIRAIERRVNNGGVWEKTLFAKDLLNINGTFYLPYGGGIPLDLQTIRSGLEHWAKPSADIYLYTGNSDRRNIHTESHFEDLVATGTGSSVIALKTYRYLGGDVLSEVPVTLASFHGEVYWDIVATGLGSSHDVCKPSRINNTLVFLFPVGFQ